jgi:hypothetical protein
MTGHTNQEPAVKSTSALAALAACATLCLPAAGFAAGPQLHIPDFSNLRQKATDSVDLTLDGFVLRIARKFAAHDEDKDDEGMQLLNDIKSIRVRNFEFDSDGAYSTADVESVRKQLLAPGWSALAQVHKREPQENVDIFINTADGKILGLAVVSSEPRSFTIVNIVGNIDIDKLAKLEGQFGIPKVTQNE